MNFLKLVLLIFELLILLDLPFLNMFQVMKAFQYALGSPSRHMLKEYYQKIQLQVYRAIYLRKVRNDAYNKPY